MEIWTELFGWGGLYEVSSHGRVRSIKRSAETLLGTRSYGGGGVKLLEKNNGYFVVNLTDKERRQQISIHRAVLLSFVGEPKKGIQGRHRDGIKSNNRLDNLQWGTSKENHQDRYGHGTILTGEKNPIAKLNADMVVHIRTSGKSNDELAREFGLSRGCIEKAKYRQTWKHIK